jgi:hypothetical protein
MRWVVDYTGYPMPEECPHVRITTQAYIEQVSGIDDAVAWHADGENRLLLARDVMAHETPLEVRSTIVHEFVHIAGDHRTEGASCAQRRQYEVEAYMAQAQYVAAVSGDSLKIDPRALACSE